MPCNEDLPSASARHDDPHSDGYSRRATKSAVHGHIYQSRRGVNGEARFALTTHSEGDVGVCFKNFLDYAVPNHAAATRGRVIELDVDIGADAVDYKCVAGTSLSIILLTRATAPLRTRNPSLHWRRRCGNSRAL